MNKFEKGLQLKQLNEKGIDVFGAEEKFSIWAKEFNPALQQRPIELFSSKTGIKRINDLLTRIEHGVLS
jgi:uncharacterized protein (DUF2384 family)